MRLIDADALINDILTDYGCDPKYIADETIDGLKPYTDQLILERIGLQPTIDAVPVVHGEWIEKDEDFQAYLECSNCNMVFPVTVGWSFTAKTNYCPNCGARMDGERREG